ncbi:site-specific integrase [Shewanella sp. 125m-1]
MFILKNRNANYYTRVYFSQNLIHLGYPAEIRFSLKTKCRSDAVDRAIAVQSIIRPWLKHLQTQLAQNLTGVSVVISDMKQVINDLQVNDFEGDAGATIPKKNLDSKDKPMGIRKAKNEYVKSNRVLLNEFLIGKQAQQIRHSSVSLLKTRISFFLTTLDKPIIALSHQDVLRYESILISMDKSFKTKKEYLAAAKQFYGWLKKHGRLKANHLELIGLKAQRHERKKVSEQRQRWQPEQLARLFKHPNFAGLNEASTQEQKQHYWIPLLLLYTGARTGEICQLKTCDIYQKDHIWCIDINDKGDKRHLKTNYSHRIVPIHSTLIAHGFIEYVKGRQCANQTNLFHLKPTGADNDWGVGFARQFVRVLRECNMTGAQRPTLHSFRHTFIDELQQIGIEEFVANELVGHSKKSMTYGRYAKQLNIVSLKDSIERVRDFFALSKR